MQFTALIGHSTYMYTYTTYVYIYIQVHVHVFKMHFGRYHGKSWRPHPDKGVFRALDATCIYIYIYTSLWDSKLVRMTRGALRYLSSGHLPAEFPGSMGGALAILKDSLPKASRPFELWIFP